MTTTPDTRQRLLGERLRHAHQHRRFFPTDRQRELYRALVDAAPQPDAPQASGLSLVGYGGAMGGGKTRALVELAIDAALLFPGNNILVARHNFTDLATTTMADFFRYCPPGLISKRRQSPTHSVEIAAPDQPRPSTIHFRHLSDWTGLGSQQYGTVLIDEAGQVESEAAQMLVTRLRHPAQPQPWFIAASNPYPGWFERWFVKRELPEHALERADVRLKFIQARIEDNPHLPSNYADTQRAVLPPDWVDRFVEGRFDAFLGQIYPAFDPNIHCWDSPLPVFSRYIGGLDFGAESETGHFTAGIVAGLHFPYGDPSHAARPGSFLDRDSIMRPDPVTGEIDLSGPDPSHFVPSHFDPSNHDPDDPDDPDDPHQPTLIRVAEFEQRGPGVTRRLEQWMKRCRRQFGPITWCADRSQSAWISHLARSGLPIRPSQGGPGSVHVGIALVQQQLDPDNPRSFYIPSLTQFPLRMRDYRWSQRHDYNPEPHRKNDDLLDADRYLHELANLSPQGGRGRRSRLVRIVAPPPLGRPSEPPNHSTPAGPPTFRGIPVAPSRDKPWIIHRHGRDSYEIIYPDDDYTDPR